MDKNDIINYVMHTPHNTNRAVLNSMLNQLIEGGGSGSSDFSTAEVTINVNLPEGETVETIEASIGFGSLDQLGIYTGTTVADANNKISIIMYKGSGYIESIHVLTSESNYTFYSNFTTASGDVVWDSNVGFYGGWNVTGDGSLTTTFPYPEDND